MFLNKRDISLGSDILEVAYPLDSGLDLVIATFSYILTFGKWILANIGTLGMFLLTLFYVIYTKKLMQQGEINLKRSQKPDVIAYFEAERTNVLNFIIKNIGNSPAINLQVNLEILDGIVREERFKKAFMLNNIIPTLAPDQKLETFVDVLHSMKDDNGNFPRFKVTLTYLNTDGDEYFQSFILDINMYKGLTNMVVKDVHDLVKEVEKIRKSIDK